MKIKSNIFTFALLTPIFFTASLVLLHFYDGGDQVAYLNFYEALGESSYQYVMPLAKAYVDSSEPISAYLLWFGSTVGIDKTLYISMLNVLLLSLILFFLLKYKVNAFLIFLILTNFYVIVLLTSAERLKIAYIMLLIAVFLEGRSKILFFLFSPLAHLQSLILMPAMILYKYFRYLVSSLFRMKVNKKFLYTFLSFFILIFLVVFISFEGVVDKANSYLSDDMGVLSTYQAIILFLLSFAILNDKIGALVMFLFFLISILLIGSERVNMIYFTVIVYILVSERKLSRINFKNFPIVMVLCYISIKSIGYVSNVVLYGSGFYSG